MQDRACEQKVRVFRNDVWMGRRIVKRWTWECDIHDCPEPLYGRHGGYSQFELTVHEADRHARSFHQHRHLPHDL